MRSSLESSTIDLKCLRRYLSIVRARLGSTSLPRSWSTSWQTSFTILTQYFHKQSILWPNKQKRALYVLPQWHTYENWYIIRCSVAFVNIYLVSSCHYCWQIIRVSMVKCFYSIWMVNIFAFIALLNKCTLNDMYFTWQTINKLPKQLCNVIM